MEKLALLFMLMTFNMFSQSINDYETVIVPEKFDGFKEENQYNLNVTTKLLLEKYGFVVYMNNKNLPSDIANNRCKSLTADLINDSGFLSTRLKLVLKDCQENIVYETRIGTSKEKDYADAYKLAFRDAAKSFETLNYKYTGQTINSIKSNEVKPKTTESNVVSEVFKSSQTAVPVGEPTHTFANGQFYAQPIEHGFQLVNIEPKVIYKIYNTSVPEFFIATKGEQQGVFFKKDNKWYFEYYQSNKLYSENVGVKF